MRKYKEESVLIYLTLVRNVAFGLDFVTILNNFNDKEMALRRKQRIKKEQVFAYSFKPLHLNINN